MGFWLFWTTKALDPTMDDIRRRAVNVFDEHAMMDGLRDVYVAIRILCELFEYRLCACVCVRTLTDCAANL